MTFITLLQTKEYKENHRSGRNQWLDNLDLRPVTQDRRTYGWKAYLWFWISANATPATFYGVSAALAAGLSLWEALMCQLGGQSELSVPPEWKGEKN
jgi:NCS1 family nucleobase:cation symporter-1